MSPESASGSVHTVRQGECVSSIADEYGHFWETVWTHPDNSELKERRGDPNVLLPGDRVAIPPLRQREEDCATSERHTFRKVGVPAKLRLAVLVDGEPRAGEDYVLTVDGQELRGTLDDQGRLDHSIPPDARRCTLRVGEDEEEYTLRLGELDPVSEISGLQARLNNLGFSCGPADGIIGPLTRGALREFQSRHGLEVTGEPDDATRSKLVEVHGS